VLSLKGALVSVGAHFSVVAPSLCSAFIRPRFVLPSMWGGMLAWCRLRLYSQPALRSSCCRSMRWLVISITFSPHQPTQEPMFPWSPMTWYCSRPLYSSGISSSWAGVGVGTRYRMLSQGEGRAPRRLIRYSDFSVMCFTFDLDGGAARATRILFQCRRAEKTRLFRPVAIRIGLWSSRSSGYADAPCQCENLVPSNAPYQIAVPPPAVLGNIYINQTTQKSGRIAIFLGWRHRLALRCMCYSVHI